MQAILVQNDDVWKLPATEHFESLFGQGNHRKASGRRRQNERNFAKRNRGGISDKELGMILDRDLVMGKKKRKKRKSDPNTMGRKGTKSWNTRRKVL